MDILVPAILVAMIGAPCVFYLFSLLDELGFVDWGGTGRARMWWRAAARAAGLSNVEESRKDLTGWAGSLRVRLSLYWSGRVHGTRITVSGSPLPSDLTVRPEGAGDFLRGVRGVREIEIGHDSFDAAAWVQGSPSVARAVLDNANRKAIRALFDGRLERPGRSPFWATGRLEEGVLSVDVPEAAPPTAGERSEPGGWAVTNDYVGGHDRLHEVLSAVLALAQRLETPKDVPRRLADRLKTEPVAGVRLHLLTTLVREFPDHAATREALLAAGEDPDAEVRLQAAIALGPEGRDVLLAIARGEGAPDETTARAVAALEPDLTVDESMGLLRSALRTRRTATARACLVAVGRRGGAEAIALLARVLAVETGELAWAAARALAMTRNPAAEEPLLRALAEGTRDVRLAAAAALRHVGTAAAVAALREREEDDAEMRRAVRQAIAEIQSRLAGAEHGQLSLAGGEAGQLSLARTESGHLSIAEGEADRLGVSQQGRAGGASEPAR